MQPVKTNVVVTFSKSRVLRLMSVSDIMAESGLYCVLSGWKLVGDGVMYMPVFS